MAFVLGFLALSIALLVVRIALGLGRFIIVTVPSAVARRRAIRQHLWHVPEGTRTWTDAP